MSVRIKLHDVLREYVNGQALVEANGKTIGECIDDLERRYPGFKKQLCFKNGKLLDYFDIYINNISAYPDEFSKPVNDDDEIAITVFLAGG